MNIKAMKTTGLSIALATAFSVAAGAAGGSIAFAQDWQWRDRDYDGRIYNGRDRIEERRGFNDGLIAGRRDALAQFSFNPSASIRYQLGGFYYRRGFQSGYAQAYRKNANNDGYRNNNWYGRDEYYSRNRQRGYYDRLGNFHRY